MAILYFDIVGGIAGDMTVAALIELGVPLETLREGIAALGVEGIAIGTERAARHQIAGTRFVVRNTLDAGGAPAGYGEDGHAHPHEGAPGHLHPREGAAGHLHPHEERGHALRERPTQALVPDHERSGGHPHRPYREVQALLARAALPGGAKAIAERIFARLAEAEAAAHGVPLDKVELHEVGAWDSIADVVCAAIALDHLRPDAVYCSVVPLGAGTARTMHGRMPVPGPATLALLRGFPVQTGGPAFERTTPTGAAILAAVARPAPQPFRFVPQRVGIGLGTLDPPEVANVLRAVWADPAEPGHLGAAPRDEDSIGGVTLDEDGGDDPLDARGITRETIECAEANLDDSNPEWIGYLMERLFAAGALDVVLIPVQMKKNRPGTLVQALYRPELRGMIETVFFTESTTLGVRYRSLERAALPREATSVPTQYGDVAGKLARTPAGVRFAPEFESCRAAAERAGVPLQAVYLAALESWLRRED